MPPGYGPPGDMGQQMMAELMQGQMYAGQQVLEVAGQEGMKMAMPQQQGDDSEPMTEQHLAFLQQVSVVI